MENGVDIIIGFDIISFVKNSYRQEIKLNIEWIY